MAEQTAFERQEEKDRNIAHLTQVVKAIVQVDDLEAETMVIVVYEELERFPEFRPKP